MIAMTERFCVKLQPDDLVVASKFASELEVPRNIHPDDFIFQFLISNPVFQTRSDALRYYFFDGLNSAKSLRDVLGELRVSETATLLEFASGYGCVTRHLSKTLPRTQLTSCDIHSGAVAFLGKELKASAVLSDRVPEHLNIRQLYDVVFALSFFSHMPRSTWLRWLLALYARVRPGGHLIFTTHGAVSAQNHFGKPEVPADGFWFRADSEQKDIDVNDYGMTITLRRFVEGLEQYLPGGGIKIFREAYWWKHQDLWVVYRDA